MEPKLTCASTITENDLLIPYTVNKINTIADGIVTLGGTLTTNTAPLIDVNTSDGAEALRGTVSAPLPPATTGRTWEPWLPCEPKGPFFMDFHFSSPDTASDVFTLKARTKKITLTFKN